MFDERKKKQKNVRTCLMNEKKNKKNVNELEFRNFTGVKSMQIDLTQHQMKSTGIPF